MAEGTPPRASMAIAETTVNGDTAMRVEELPSVVVHDADGSDTLIEGMEYVVGPSATAARTGGDGMDSVEGQPGTPTRTGDGSDSPTRGGNISPQRSWFGAIPNLFQWRADSYEMVAEVSGAWSEDITGVVRATLSQLRIKSQDRSAGMGYKCKWDGIPASQRASHLPAYAQGSTPVLQDLPFVKFKVDYFPVDVPEVPTGSVQSGKRVWRIIFTQQQGSSSSLLYCFHGFVSAWSQTRDIDIITSTLHSQNPPPVAPPSGTVTPRPSTNGTRLAP
ncbi:hypothetical protein M427DRAFT_61011 [Gonapodya prolifera JEL478]|uniref:Uncharacterized protein n=1 Tax=Gonapodya prolifera (strain JEL478) TaxID=1344416 RepID=A0A139A382_GONPJ|nr:hypothetical protein M427DRAFT_61011 [Gonapodya prolifera JEL478]|eukprot:KXS11221.1 hypothetical protein M427DRAFT_61011 [Gonapodya prolifera JEL478]